MIRAGNDLVAIEAQYPATASSIQPVIAGSREITGPWKAEYAGPVLAGDSTGIVGRSRIDYDNFVGKTLDAGEALL